MQFIEVSYIDKGTRLVYNLKNQLLEQDLSNEQKQLLADAGNDITEMVTPSSFIDTFSEDKITYFKDKNIMINNITGDVHDTEAMCPEYKVVAVRIRKSKGKFKKELV